MSAIVLGLIAAASWGFHDFCVIAFAIANFGLYGAFQRGPVWLAAPLIACFSVISVGWSALDGAAIIPMQWLAVLVIMLGIGIVAILSDETDDRAPGKGPTILYALVAAFAFSATFRFGQAVTEVSNEMMSALATRLIAIGTIVVVFVAMRLPFWPGKQNLWLLGIMGIAHVNVWFTDYLARVNVLERAHKSQAMDWLHHRLLRSRLLGAIATLLRSDSVSQPLR